MAKQVLEQAKEKMNKTIAAFTRELSSIRAGRANASLLDRIMVDYYGARHQLISLRVFLYQKLAY